MSAQAEEARQLTRQLGNTTLKKALLRFSAVLADICGVAELRDKVSCITNGIAPKTSGSRPSREPCVSWSERYATATLEPTQFSS
jgi:hypothetical protein